tara:strand:- start:1221 stop:1967 length:747 start_codon:yes stop_codon:yes gene_type:complete
MGAKTTKKRVLSSVQRARDEAKYNKKRIDQKTNAMWNAASKCPLFCKREEKVINVLDANGDPEKDENGKNKTMPVLGEDGKPLYVVRTTRLISSHAFNIASAGATRAAVREVRNDCYNMGTEYEEKSDKASFHLPLARGTKLMLEQFMSAYLKSGMLSAWQFKEGIGKQKRLKKEHVRAAFRRLNERLNPLPRSASMICPLTVAGKALVNNNPVTDDHAFSGNNGGAGDDEEDEDDDADDAEEADEAA